MERISGSYCWRTSKLTVDCTGKFISSMGRRGFTCDSFTYNIYHFVSKFNVKVEVIRNDKITSTEVNKRKYTKIVISPGPGNPLETGNCIGSN